jgi:hypothetical protein
MRRRQTFPVPVLGVILLGLVGCGGDRPQPRAEPPTSTTIGVQAALTTTVVGTSTTVTTLRAPATSVRATTTTTAAPVLREGIPQVTAAPARAAVGERVRIEGTGFSDGMWRSADEPLWLAGAVGGCSFYAEAAHSVTVSAAGHLAGEFTVPTTGGCRMSDIRRPVISGTYKITFSCTPCFIGELVVTSPAIACQNVSFTPNTDDAAGSIIATGTTCAEAEALVRKVGALGGPPGMEADGYVCAQTGQSDVGLASTEYECTNGPKKVTFNRT